MNNITMNDLSSRFKQGDAVWIRGNFYRVDDTVAGTDIDGEAFQVRIPEDGFVNDGAMSYVRSRYVDYLQTYRQIRVEVGDSGLLDFSIHDAFENAPDVLNHDVVVQGDSVTVTLPGAVIDVTTDQVIAEVVDNDNDPFRIRVPRESVRKTIPRYHAGQMYRKGTDVFVVGLTDRVSNGGKLQVTNVYTGETVPTMYLHGAKLIADSNDTASEG